MTPSTLAYKLTYKLVLDEIKFRFLRLSFLSVSDKYGRNFLGELLLAICEQLSEPLSVVAFQKKFAYLEFSN